MKKLIGLRERIIIKIKIASIIMEKVGNTQKKCPLILQSQIAKKKGLFRTL